jgi:putative ubiquitin-RnfH superfamily antitoxin RatB of RatAB toxin-antitoxin module
VIAVEVVYVAPDGAFRRRVELRSSATVGEAIDASGVLEARPEVDITRMRTGIFGRLASLATELADGDRVEIYRPLVADPKDRRRRRAELQRRSTKGSRAA